MTTDRSVWEDEQWMKSPLAKALRAMSAEEKMDFVRGKPDDAYVSDVRRAKVRKETSQ